MEEFELPQNDHRRIGRELELFMFSAEIGKGLPIWLPNGTILRKALENYLRQVQTRCGYQEVMTPHIANLDLYKKSGHYPYYKDSQFDPIQVEDEQYMLKPMNCPHHHHIFSSKPRTYRELPVRLSEFGTVYRYEASGSLSGLTRVRGFTQDDAHIYCRVDQVKDEIKNVIELTKSVFDVFGLQVSTRLSFRDDNEAKYGGDNEQWERSQREIQEVADELGLSYTVAEGEAAFYGPKIDFTVKDALNRDWQLGTVQVDYVMPERFDLEYVGSDGEKHRPVILHRAPFGSIERFIAILIEHYNGSFPFWLAPVQVNILPISDKLMDYAYSVKAALVKHGVRAVVDERSEKLQRKVLDSEMRKIPYALVVGNREAAGFSVSVREHKVGDIGSMSLSNFVHICEELQLQG